MKTETKHTPGPWHVAAVIFSKPMPPHEALAVWDESHGQKPDSILGRPICVLTPLDKMSEMDKANARRIAAVPAMVSALKAISHTGGGALSKREMQSIASAALLL